MSIFVCKVCGHLEFGAAPDNCPVCHVPKDNFKQNDNVFSEALEKSPEGGGKHTPVLLIKEDCGLIDDACTDVHVKVGKIIHPMEDAHSIVFIDCYIDDKYVARVSLRPGVYAAGCFHTKPGGKKLRVVELCNLHGYWQVEADF